MPVHIAMGLKAPSIESVSEALRLTTGHDPEPHESLYLGEYDLFRLPEEVQVKYNFVAAEGEWDYPAHQVYGILLIAGETERPEYMRALATGLGYESSVLEESVW
jgi:hypothetical protein